MDGCPLGLGLVVEDKPTKEFSCMWCIFVHSVHVYVCTFMCVYVFVQI